MRRWLRCSPELPAVGLAALAVGVVAERASYRFGDVGHWLPDLVTGLTLVACGVVATAVRPASRSGRLLQLAGFAWFAGSFTSAALIVHRGLLAQLALTFPSGRMQRRLERFAVALAYAISLVTAFWLSDVGTALFAVLLVLVAVRLFVTSFGRRRHERRFAFYVSALFAALLGALVVADVLVSTSAGRHAALIAYELGLVLFAVLLAVLLHDAPWERADVTDLVVELGEKPVPTLRDALAYAIGDPSLEVGYRVAGREGYVDASGRPVELGDERSVTPLQRDGREVAVVLHDPVVLDDPELLDALAVAARLTAENAGLQAEVRAQVAELEASRRRLLEAGDAERRRLERRLQDGAARRLDLIRELLTQARGGGADVAFAARLSQAEAHLGPVAKELDTLAAGLHPSELTEHGLAAAVASLAERSPVPVGLSVVRERLPSGVESTAYFVCSEALANVAKHASASQVEVSVNLQGRFIAITVCDDGVGGASLDAGSGLRGLIDRVEAAGGTFEFDSPPAGGTRLRAVLPR